MGVGEAMRGVPTYALYGEPAAREGTDFLHCETIEARSRLHDFRIRPHRHEQLFQMLFLSGGEGEATIDGAQAGLPPPCLALVPAFVVHGYAFSNTVEGLVLTLYQDQLAAILRTGPEALGSLAAPHILALAGQQDAARTIAASLQSVAAEFAGAAAGRAAMMQAHLAVALLTADRARTTLACRGAEPPPRGLGHVVRFRQMIDRDFRAHVPIAQYARRLGMTDVHLRRLCREHLGATPLAALNARVVLEARRLLVFSTLGVKEVAAATGFTDEAYFSRFFLRETGLSPTAFRATQRMTGQPPPAAPPPRSAARRPATGRSAV